MSLISASIPNFVNGISQQPFTLRLPSQGQSQINGLSTVSSGLRKRPPTEHLAKIASAPISDAFLHMIDRDGIEQYQVILTNGDLKVYDLAGTAQTVNFTNKAYLNTSLPSTDTFAVTTVADFSFIVNKTTTVLANTTTQGTRSAEALVYVRQGNFGKTYGITLNGVEVTVVTPTGSVASDITAISTDTIAANLRAALVGAGFNQGPWGCFVTNSVITIVNASSDFTLTTRDGFSSLALIQVKGKIRRFSDLPGKDAPVGFTVQITGDLENPLDNYWVQWGGLTWKETLGPGVSQGLNTLTMPHQLVREANGTFSFRPGAWKARLVGDAVTSPNPSFVNATINDIFFFQNRLGLLSRESFLMSEVGNYFNMFRTTVASLLDGDPVDVTAATNKVSVLRHAVGFNKDLLLFSNQQQFIVSSGELMTPKRVPIKPTTDFNVNVRAKPAVVGKNVYFTADLGNFSAVSEYFVDSNNLTNDATDITAHVPTYVPSRVIKIASAQSSSVMAVLSESARSKLYIYKYFFSGTEKLQSSWSEFSFDPADTILGCDFIKATLYLVISRADGVFLEKMDFSMGASSVGEPYRVHLDRRVKVAKSFLSFDGTKTIISLSGTGYAPQGGSYLAVTQGSTTVKPAVLLTVTYAGGVLSVPGNMTSTDLFFGRSYLFRYVVSPLVVRMQVQGQTRAADTEGRLQVRKISFNHADTGVYKVAVTPEARQTFTYVFTGEVIGTSSSTIGSVGISTGRMSVPVMSRNTTVEIAIESALPLPVAIFSADWEGLYVKRSRPV